MLGWVYLVGVSLAVTGLVYLDRGSVGRGHITIQDAIQNIAKGRELGEMTEAGPPSRA